MIGVPNDSTNFADEDPAERRSAARKLACILGVAIVLLYVGGFFVSR